MEHFPCASALSRKGLYRSKRRQWFNIPLVYIFTSTTQSGYSENTQELYFQGENWHYVVPLSSPRPSVRRTAGLQDRHCKKKVRQELWQPADVHSRGSVSPQSVRACKQNPYWGLGHLQAEGKPAGFGPQSTSTDKTGLREIYSETSRLHVS